MKIGATTSLVVPGGTVLLMMIVGCEIISCFMDWQALTSAERSAFPSTIGVPTVIKINSALAKSEKLVLTVRFPISSASASNLSKPGSEIGGMPAFIRFTLKLSTSTATTSFPRTASSDAITDPICPTPTTAILKAISFFHPFLSLPQLPCLNPLDPFPRKPLICLACVCRQQMTVQDSKISKSLK